MATFDVSGLDELVNAIEDISKIPWDVEEDALNAMSKVAEAAVKRTGENMGVRDPDSKVHILDNITHTKPKKTLSGGYSDITFKGRRKRGNTNTRNAEIAFINEYGKRGQPARPFIRQAAEQDADAIAAPGEKIIGDWFEKTLA